MIFTLSVPVDVVNAAAFVGVNTAVTSVLPVGHFFGAFHDTVTG